VQAGDCIESIAFEHGFFWKTLWDHAKNHELHKVRKDPNVLLAGDRVFVPELQLKQEEGATERRHRYKRKGVPSKLNITLKDEHDRPRAHEKYILEIDGQTFAGTTDASGSLQHPIPPNARRGTLRFGPNGERQIPLVLGDIDPITEVSGVQGRLNNLGYECGPINGQANEETRSAIRSFQQAYGLQETGEMNEETRNKLQEIYGA
jgi:N-acetylmuramoyl-L-alanine amidase